jgi:hypothetical protein
MRNGGWRMADVMRLPIADFQLPIAIEDNWKRTAEI